MKTIREFINESDSVVLVGINSMNPSHSKQVKQIQSVLKSFPDTVYDNVIKKSSGSFVSITVKDEIKANLIQYLRNVKNKVDGWDILS